MEEIISEEPIRVRCYGADGPLVVVLHGGPGAPGSMAPLARRLGERFRVLEPLQRTSGGSPLTVERHIRDLSEVLASLLGEGPLRLVGFSWGAMLALTYAARKPRDISRLVLIGCGTLDPVSRGAYLISMEERIDTRTRKRLDLLEAELALETDRHRRNVIFSEFGRIYTRLQAYAPVSADEDPLSCDEAGFNETWKDAIRLQEEGVQPAEFAAVTAPVTMIHGEHDPHPGPLIYDSLAPHIQNLEYLELPKCGHTPWMEKEAGAGFYSILFQYLEQPPSTPSNRYNGFTD